MGSVSNSQASSRASSRASRPLLKLLLGFVMVVGFGLIAVGALWSRIAPQEAIWSKSQAQEYEQAAANAHALFHGRQHAHDELHEEDEHAFQAAKQKLQGLQRDLEQARHVRNSGGFYLCIAGMFALAASGVGFYLMPTES